MAIRHVEGLLLHHLSGDEGGCGESKRLIQGTIWGEEEINVVINNRRAAAFPLFAMFFPVYMYILCIIQDESWDRGSPNTGVSIGLSSGEVSTVFLSDILLNSLFTAARASGFVNK